MSRGRVLLVDDEREMCTLLSSALTRRGWEIRWTDQPALALGMVAGEPFDVVVTDLIMPGIDGNTLCRSLVAERGDIPVIVVTAFGSLESAVSAIRAGAYDFITKPFDTDILDLALDRALRHRMLQLEVRQLRDVVSSSGFFDDLIGDCEPMREVKDFLTRVADTDATVLITGETGTGKEVAARMLHRTSRRRKGPFVAINCAALPTTLLESEFFGHVRGAFTDARSSRTGLFVQADQGTLFLDEIGSMPMELQPKILRALQERSVRPLGGDQDISFDTRIIAATNQDLEDAVEEGRFRLDLYYRVNVVHLELPPLRARGGDILLLAQRFLAEHTTRSGRKVSGFSRPAAERLLSYPWPGNVRELQNCVERAVALARYDQVLVEDLPEKIRRHRTSDVILAALDPTELVTMEEVERRYVRRVLEAVGGNKTLAARVLGYDRKTLYRKLERYGLPVSGEN